MNSEVHAAGADKPFISPDDPLVQVSGSLTRKTEPRTSGGNARWKGIPSGVTSPPIRPVAIEKLRRQVDILPDEALVIVVLPNGKHLTIVECEVFASTTEPRLVFHVTP